MASCLLKVRAEVNHCQWCYHWLLLRRVRICQTAVPLEDWPLNVPEQSTMPRSNFARMLVKFCQQRASAVLSADHVAEQTIGRPRHAAAQNEGRRARVNSRIVRPMRRRACRALITTHEHEG